MGHHIDWIKENTDNDQDIHICYDGKCSGDGGGGGGGNDGQPWVACTPEQPVC